jgi:hypothetical protein
MVLDRLFQASDAVEGEIIVSVAQLASSVTTPPIIDKQLDQSHGSTPAVAAAWRKW